MDVAFPRERVVHRSGSLLADNPDGVVEVEAVARRGRQGRGGKLVGARDTKGRAVRHVHTVTGPDLKGPVGPQDEFRFYFKSRGGPARRAA